MFNKVLIANRGEIAVRVIRCLKEMGIASVAVYSQADKDALHVQLADEAVCIGPPRAVDSYLNMNNIISAAINTGAQAIHPGFGFLSENEVFASMCGECNIKFIGPDPYSIGVMGNKANARRLMIQAGVPVIPGTEGTLDTYEDAEKAANSMGFPVMIKASAGGGGKGIRMVSAPEELRAQFDAAKVEAKAAFGDDSIYMEKVVTNARHIEVQILADEHGNVLHLGERDCSLQRRNQKVLEEAPSVALTQKLRNQIGKAAVLAAKAANYKNAGTIEFLYKDGEFMFMEMNTRIQVEHPVTEMVTGIDIVQWQVRIAAGQPLDIKQSDVQMHGHALECRINAENPARGFAPSPGKVAYMHMPSGGLGLRVDSAMFAGYTIPPYYDSMIAKVITHGKDREQAIAKMKRALHELVINGIDTNIDFQLDILHNPTFAEGTVDTGFIAREILK
ncbi:MAG: acetyl-CoA carboxylase biotin carboxylase subunit [Defluviitaleaceae bacterium]|nr:acetyl-CoA carboxylase biotin carboxylase subunit [Defluviitaleaceae bacterium]